MKAGRWWAVPTLQNRKMVRRALPANTLGKVDDVLFTGLVEDGGLCRTLQDRSLVGWTSPARNLGLYFEGRVFKGLPQMLKRDGLYSWAEG